MHGSHYVNGCTLRVGVRLVSGAMTVSSRLKKKGKKCIYF